jgi:hypothetical protein
MKSIRTTAIVATAAVLMLIGDAPPQAPSIMGLQFVPEAHAIFGVWRRHARRWAVVGTAAVASAATATAATEAAAANQQAAAAQKEAAAAQQQAAATQQQAAQAQRQAAAAAPPPPPPAAAGKPLPLGTVVHALPAGCTTTPVGGVEYYYCGGNFYRAVFQGNSLVYVTAQP